VPDSNAAQGLRLAVRRGRLGLALGALNHPHLLARLYGGSDKAWHGYMPHYRRHLRQFRFKRCTVFEIGVGGYSDATPGGSLAIWRDYFTRAQIVGIDVHPKDVRLGSRVHFELADQGSPEALNAVVGRYGAPDVVIDDGSHVGRDISTSFETLYPLMPEGSVYVIEDLHTSFYAASEGGDPAPATSAVGLLQDLVSDVQAADRVFVDRPTWGDPPTVLRQVSRAVHVYPGIAFIEKSST
jgi:hypothetical protein